MIKKSAKLSCSILIVLLLLILLGKIFNFHLTPVNAMKYALKEKNITVDNYYSLKHDKNIYYISNNENKSILISVHRWARIFWTVGEQLYKEVDDLPVIFNVRSDNDFSIVYGVCNNKDIDFIQLMLENNEILNSKLQDGKLFVFTYDNSILYWKELIAYSKSKKIIWSYSN